MASKNTSKKPKKEIKDSVDVSDIKVDEKVETSTIKEGKELKTKRPFKERYVDFVTEHKVPIVSYCHQLNHVDYKRYKENPTGLSNDTLFIKNASNKKRFFLKITYLILMIIIGLLLIVLGGLFMANVFDLGSLSGPDGNNGRSLLSGAFMAIGIIMIGIFI